MQRRSGVFRNDFRVQLSIYKYIGGKSKTPASSHLFMVRNREATAQKQGKVVPQSGCKTWWCSTYEDKKTDNNYRARWAPSLAAEEAAGYSINSNANSNSLMPRTRKERKEGWFLVWDFYWALSYNSSDSYL